MYNNNIYIDIYAIYVGIRFKTIKCNFVKGQYFCLNFYRPIIELSITVGNHATLSHFQFFTHGEQRMQWFFPCVLAFFVIIIIISISS